MSTYTPIASVTLGSAQSSVTFSGIPQTYTDLVVVGVGYNGAGDGYTPRIQFNSDTGNNYSLTALSGNGTTASSSRSSNRANILVGYVAGWSTSSSNVGMFKTQIMNYTNNTTYKTILSRFDQSVSSYPGTDAIVGLWRNTSAITSITILGDTGVSQTFASGSTFNLYGVANASITNTAKATGGDTITTDGTYWYHTFYSSGTFTPTQALTADYLVVAGGGGGSGVYGAGGGGGGLRCTVTATGGGGSVESALSLTAQAYTVTVGAGGAGGYDTSQRGFSGSNSVFSTITSTGGGGAGVFGAGLQNGLTGGSGGGGAFNSSSNAAGTANQGYAGGYGDSGSGNSGGGGGAGAVGANATSTTGGNGGNGVATSISGTSTTYGGGGGASGGSGVVTVGTGGTGGGGNAGTTGNATSGGTNTGGGGGGNGKADTQSNKYGAAGGSGIVIVRYAV